MCNSKKYKMSSKYNITSKPLYFINSNYIFQLIVIYLIALGCQKIFIPCETVSHQLRSIISLQYYMIKTCSYHTAVLVN